MTTEVLINAELIEINYPVYGWCECDGNIEIRFPPRLGFDSAPVH